MLVKSSFRRFESDIVTSPNWHFIYWTESIAPCDVPKGYLLEPYPEGREDWEVFQALADEIDCVILDLAMPEISGEEVFGELRRLRPDVRVIPSSGSNIQKMTQRFAGQGVAGFIKKPYRVANLQEILSRVLD